MHNPIGGGRPFASFLVRRLERRSQRLQAASIDLEAPREQPDARQALFAQGRLETVLGLTHTGMDVIDPDFGVVYVDPLWLERLGPYRAGCKCYEYFKCRETICPDCAIPKALETRQPQMSEQVIREGEEERVVEVHTIPFQDEAGKWLVAEFNIDITERRKAENALRESEERNRALVEATPDTVFVVDREGTFLDYHCHDQADLLLPPSGFLGKRLSRVMPPEIALPSVACLERAFATGLPQDLEYDLPPFFGNRTFIARMVRMSNDKALVSCREVTEQRKAERERAKIEENMRQSLKMEAIGRLAGGVAHDFNNMLNVIIGFSEMARAAVKPEDPISEYLDTIHEAAMRSADFTRQLLAFSRKQVIAPRAVDLNAAVADSTRMLSRLVGEDIRFVFEPGPDLWTVMMDPTQLDMLLANLAVNAREAIEGHGQVVVSTCNAVVGIEDLRLSSELLPGEYVRLEFSDTGKGMDAETAARIFEPFFSTKLTGTGLGLATVYGVVSQNKGAVTVTSEKGKGTLFSIYLPRYSGPGIAAPAAAPPEAAASKGAETVLVVEDQEQVLELARSILEMYGYNVLAVRSATKAVELAKERSGAIDLLLSDLVMPEMNGRQLSSAVKASNPQTRTLFMTGYPSQLADRHGLLESGIELIEKPFSVKALASQVRKVLDAGRQGNAG